MSEHDRLQRDVLLPVTPERAWALVTEARHFATWYAFGGAEIDARPGGALALHWAEHGTFHGIVEVVDPPRRFAFRWAHRPDEQPRAGNSTLVEFTLRAEGGGTRLTVVESGFATLDADLAEALAMNTMGWRDGLAALERLAAGQAA